MAYSERWRRLAVVTAVLLTSCAPDSPTTASLNVRDAQLSWDYSQEDQVLITEFRLYRALGELCATLSPLLLQDTPIAVIAPALRTARDANIPDDFAGEACYVLTAYGQGMDPATGLPTLRESEPSNRAAKAFLSKPAWWGDTAEVR